ncbi:MAG: hypothetical protein ACFFA0_08965 [Promethearchaeota archaeon]
MTDKKTTYFVRGFFFIGLGVFLACVSVYFIFGLYIMFIGLFLVIMGGILILIGFFLHLGTSSGIFQTNIKMYYQRDKCPKCGIKISPGYNLCLSCGYKFFTKPEEILTPPFQREESKDMTSHPQFRPISELLENMKSSGNKSNHSIPKSEDLKPIVDISEKKEEKPTKFCPYCGKKIPVKAKFCAWCGKKIEKIQPKTEISYTREQEGKIDLSWLKQQYYSLGRSIQDIADELNVSMVSIRKLLDRLEAISEEKEEKEVLEKTAVKLEDLHPIPPVSDAIEEESNLVPDDQNRSSTLVSERNIEQPIKLSKDEPQPISLIIETKEMESEVPPVEKLSSIPQELGKKVEKSKLKRDYCKFCGIRLPKNTTFCLQCGIIIKSI